MSNIITWSDIVGMINHWTGTPENGSLGSDYGGHNTLKAYLEQPSEENLSTFISKIQNDVPILKDKFISLSQQGASSVLISVNNDSAVISLVS